MMALRKLWLMILVCPGLLLPDALFNWVQFPDALFNGSTPRGGEYTSHSLGLEEGQLQYEN